MGLQSTLWTGANGLLSYQTAIDALANNTSNVNTIGYKKLDTNFNDLLYNSLDAGNSGEGNYGSTNPDSIGNGVMVASQTFNFTQGPLTSTGNTFDFAIDGEGFFVIDGADAGSGREYLTRAGDFYVGSTTNKNIVDLLTNDGLAVKGYMASSGILSNNMTSITLPAIGSEMPGESTTTITTVGNLSSGAGITKSNTVTAADGWLDAHGNLITDLHIGGVQSSAYLHDKGKAGASAGAATLLTELTFTGMTQEENLFRNIPAGSTVDKRELNIEFTRNGQTYSKTFAVTATTTLEDLSKWLCGALGDANSGGRYDGGVLGTVYAQEYIPSETSNITVAAEQAGGFLSVDDKGVQFNIASNVGFANLITDITLTATTVVTDDTGRKQNILDSFDYFFDQNKKFSEGLADANHTVSYDKITVGTSKYAMNSEKQYLNFVKVESDDTGSTWRWNVIESGNIDDPDSRKGTGIGQGSGVVRFNTNGTPVESLVDGGSSFTFDFSGMTQFGSSDSLSALTDGYVEGCLKQYSSGLDGVISGQYDNGYTFTLAQLAIATVPNVNGLDGASGTLFSATDISGAAVYSSPGKIPYGFGDIRSGYIEESNFELGAQSIIYMRAYQMSSRLVNVANEMLQTTVGLKS